MSPPTGGPASRESPSGGTTANGAGTPEVPTAPPMPIPPTSTAASGGNGPLTPPEALRALQFAVGRSVIGYEEVVRLLSISLVSEGHVLLEGVPGIAKTFLVRRFAECLQLSFKRIQFTPDMLPSDIIGAVVLNPTTTALEYRQGPIFANVILADEINRAPPKVQSALLEAMQERQVTTERGTYPLGRPFLVLATQNPLELEGTYPLPEAQVDRFLMRLSVGHPTAEEEQQILSRRRARKTDDVVVPNVLSGDEFLSIQQAAEDVEVHPAVEKYIVELVSATRGDARAEVGASPRGSLALLRLSRARALLEGRDFVLPDDVKSFAVPALAHRIIIKPEPWIRGIRGSDVVESAVGRVSVPKLP
jgi:MoxR-like ATPase